MSRTTHAVKFVLAVVLALAFCAPCAAEPVLDASGDLVGGAPSADDMLLSSCTINFMIPGGGPGYPYLFGLAVDPETGHLWGIVSGGDSGTEYAGYIHELDPDDGTVLSITVLNPKPGHTAGLGYDRLRDIFVVTDPYDDVIYIVARDGALLNTWPAPYGGAVGAAYDSRRDGYWIADWRSNTLYLIRPSDGSVVTSHYVASLGATRIAGAAYQHCDDVVIFNSRDDGLQYVIDAATGGLVSTCSLPGSYGNGAALRLSDETVYFSHWYTGYIYNSETGFASCTRFEDNDPAITYTGNWLQLSHPAASAGHLAYSAETGATAEFAFFGTGLRWTLGMGPVCGKAKVYLDGGLVGVLDLYRPYYQVRTPAKTDLPAGPHTVLIEVAGEQNPSSSGYFVDIDAFEVVP